MLADATTLSGAATDLLSKLDMIDREAMIVICGKECNAEAADAVRDWMRENHPRIELFEIDGGQDIYPFIFVLP